MNIQEEINELKYRLAKLEKQAQEQPNEGDPYWYLGLSAEPVYENWSGLDFEVEMLEAGNFFKTEEKAKLLGEKIKVEAELRKYGNHFEVGADNYHLNYDWSSSSFTVMARCFFQDQGTIYFESRAKAEEAIQVVGEDRIKKYIFEVEE